MPWKIRNVVKSLDMNVLNGMKWMFRNVPRNPGIAGRIAAFILTLQFQDLGTGGQIWDLWSENRVSSEPQSLENRVAGSHQVTPDLSSSSKLLQPPPSQTRTAKLKLPIATGEAALFAGEIEKVRSRCCSPEKQTRRLRSTGEVACPVS
ncbi:hypothetical protein Drorol1_Dr00007621 [Drosera rotundifolia]